MVQETPDHAEAMPHAGDLRNTPDGLFLRYCRGRLRSFAQRQILTLTGGLAVATLSSPQMGVTVMALALLGEGLDCLALRAVLGAARGGAVPRGARPLVTVTAAIQAATILAAVGLTLRSADRFAADFFVSAFLASAVINAGLSLPHHAGSALARIAIHMGGLCALAARSLWETVQGIALVESHGYDLVGIVVLMIMTTGFLSFVRGAHRRQVAYDRALLDERARLRTQETKARQLALVAENANDCVVITRKDGRISWVNNTFTRATGYTFDEAVGRNPGDLLNAPDTDPETVRQLINAHKSKVPIRIEVLNRRKDGSRFWMETSLTPIFNPDGSHAMTIGVERDISAMKEREAELARARQAAEEAASAKARFLATMSHEIRTPMNAVIGMAELLREGPLAPDQMHAVDTIVDAGRALLAIINDILDLARLQSGNPVIRAETFSISACVNGVIDLMGPLARAKGIALTADLSDDTPPLIGDDGRLRQILVNLVGNAIKFTPSGSVRVVLGLGRTDDLAQVEIAVIDTGIGIAGDRLEHVFDSFTQADGEITRRFGGTGLGLTISRLLAREMGGDITARSSPGAGSEFRLTLTLTVAKPDDARPTLAAAPPPVMPTAGLRILVAEDNATNRLIVSRMLSTTQAEIAFAEDGRAAVSRALDWLPDVIFMDISMPELDGIEATRRIRAAERSGDRPRAHIVALTANAFDEDRQACIAAGFDAFLTKPLNKADLLGCLTFRPVPRAANGL